MESLLNMEGFFTYVGRPAADWLQIWRWPAKANRKPAAAGPYVAYNVSYLYAAAPAVASY